MHGTHPDTHRAEQEQHPMAMDQNKAMSMSRGRSRLLQRPISELQKWVQCNKCQKWRKVRGAVETQGHAVSPVLVWNIAWQHMPRHSLHHQRARGKPTLEPDSQLGHHSCTLVDPFSNVRVVLLQFVVCAQFSNYLALILCCFTSKAANRVSEPHVSVAVNPRQPCLQTWERGNHAWQCSLQESPHTACIAVSGLIKCSQ